MAGWMSADTSINDLAARPGQAVPGYGVRNYQARGNRLSITPVDPAEWAFITENLLGLSAHELE